MGCLLKRENGQCNDCSELHLNTVTNIYYSIFSTEELVAPYSIIMCSISTYWLADAYIHVSQFGTRNHFNIMDLGSTVPCGGKAKQTAARDSTPHPWWRHQMETFSALLALCVGNSPVAGEFPAQRPVTWSFDVFFDLRLNKRLSKQSWGWWSEMPPRSLWRQCNDQRPHIIDFQINITWIFDWCHHSKAVKDPCDERI